MGGAPSNSRRIFTVLLHRHSPERFEELRQRRLTQIYPTADVRDRYRDEYDLQYPPLHRYNDLAGFAEALWDGGTRILVQCFFQGDRRKTYGQAVGANRRPDLISSSRFYPLYTQPIEVSCFPHASCQERLKRQAINDSLLHIETVAADLGGIFVDLTEEKALLKVMDVNRLLAE